MNKVRLFHILRYEDELLLKSFDSERKCVVIISCCRTAGIYLFWVKCFSIEQFFAQVMVVLTSHSSTKKQRLSASSLHITGVFLCRQLVHDKLEVGLKAFISKKSISLVEHYELKILQVFTKVCLVIIKAMNKSTRSANDNMWNIRKLL